MDFKPIKNRKIYEEIIDQVKNLITEGVLNPGDKLMPEREMAEKLKVGRSAVREAFRALEAMGIIEVRQGGGTFIKEVSKETIFETLTAISLSENETSKELLELRKALEVESAGLASIRRTEEELNNLGIILKQMEKDIKSEDIGLEADLSFHYAVSQATHNSLLISLMNSMADTMRRVLRTARIELYRAPDNPERLLKEHQRIFDAIKGGNPEEARQAMFDHLDRVEKSIIY